MGVSSQGLCRLAGVVTLLAGLLPALAIAGPAMTPERARAIGVDGYLYLYPLVTMDLTRRQLTNGPDGGGGMTAPANSLRNMAAYPTAEDRGVVRPNFDSLYSSAWLDLSGGPVLLEVPDADGRYYLLPMLDMWTDVFASPGWRTTGTGPQAYGVVPPGYTGTLPDGVVSLEAPTPHV
jgi:hypothetical protein